MIKAKELAPYILATLLAFALLFLYIWWNNQNSNTLPEVYGIM